MSYANNNYYKKGEWNAICDVCGFKFKSGQMRKRWDGLMVCAQDWEMDHPQKYIRVPSDPRSVPWIRRESGDGSDSSDLYILSISSAAGDAGDSLVHTWTLSQAPTTPLVVVFTLTSDDGEEGVNWEELSNASFSNGVTLSYDGTSLLIPVGVTSFTMTVDTIETGTGDFEYTITAGSREATGTVTGAIGVRLWEDDTVRFEESPQVRIME